MMESYERTYDDEDDFDRASLLPQSNVGIDDGAGGGAPSFRSRRGRPRQPPTDDNDNERSVNDWDGRGGRRPRPPGIAKIKSIARLGRAAPPSSSIGRDFDDDDDDDDDDVDAGPSGDDGPGYYYDDANDHSWDCSYGTGEYDGVWLNRDDPP